MRNESVRHRFLLHLSFLALLIGALPVTDRPATASASVSQEAATIKSVIAEAEEAVAVDPQNVLLRMSLVNHLIKQNQTERAIDQLEQVIKIKPDYKSAYILLAITYLEVKKEERLAEMNLNHALSYFPNDGMLLSLMGHVQVAQAQRLVAGNKLDSAIAKIGAAESQFQEAIESLPAGAMRAAAYLGLGSCFHLKADVLDLQKKSEQAANAADEAVAAYREALILQPEMRREIHDLEVELALPPPRLQKVYSLTHFSVSLQERIRRLQTKLVTAEEYSKGGRLK